MVAAMNDGAYPPDLNTPVGAVRANIGDVLGAPTTSGRADYARFSDLELQSFLNTYDSNVMRATAAAYSSLAGQVAEHSRSVRSDDESVGESKAASVYLMLARQWFDRADAADDQTAGDSFLMFDMTDCATDAQPSDGAAPYSPRDLRPAPGNDGYWLVG